MEKITRSSANEGYGLCVKPTEGLNLLDEKSIERIRKEQCYFEAVRNIEMFYKRTGLVPTSITVDSSVREYIKEQIELGDEFGEIRRPPTGYDRLAFIRFCPNPEDDYFVKVSSGCHVGSMTEIRLIHVEEL